jgi:ribosomal protein L37E
MNSSCIACGMPMERTQDFAMSDKTKNYCVHCARPDGSMRSYDEAVAGMTGWMVKTQGLDSGVARKMAIETLAKLPAWKNHN